MSNLGRLPPLQSIGRSQCVDMEEPPELSDTEIDQFLDEYNNKEKVYSYEASHPDTSATALQEHYRILTPGGHVCKRIVETATAFTHSRHSVAFSLKYSELRHMLQTRAQLQFVRDYTSRLNAAAMFVKDVEQLVRDEYNVWYSICHDALEAPPVTKLECLSSICEDLRIHMNHWNSVKQLMYTDPWLRNQLPALLQQIHHVRARLHQLRNTAIWWLDRLVQVGFRVLAHCDLDRISTDSLWSITRGLEDFNSIVVAVRQVGMGQCQAHFSLTAFNSYRDIGQTIKAVPFGRVLNLLASERSRYAAASTSQFFTGSKDLLRIALGKKGVGLYSWGEEINVRSRASRGVDTSDYHTDTGSHMSLGTAMLRVGGVTAPDLSQEASPLMDFARREKTFAQKFLQIVCHSTSLLKRPMAMPTTNNVTVITRKNRSPLLAKTKTRQQHTDASSPTNNHDNAIAKDNTTPNNTPKPPPRPKKSKDRLGLDGPEMSKKTGANHSDPNPSRKSVSWSDAGEVTVIQQLTQKYMDVLWQYLTSAMTDQLTQPVWGGPEGVRGHLGSVMLCSDLVIQVLARMIQHTCAKDIFPAGSATVLCIVAERLLVTTAWRAWDVAMCSGLASASTDKCHPVLLVDGEHATNTAKCLRDAFQPLHSALHSLHTSLSTDNGGSSKAVSLALATPTMQRLIMTCDATLRWSNTRGSLYISNWTLGAFLLITQSDFKVLGDEIRRGVANCQGVCDPQQPQQEGHTNTQAQLTPEGRTKNQLKHLQKQVEDFSAQHQVLSGLLIRQFSERCHSQSMEYFDEEMPATKIWKKRQYPDGPLEPSPYVEHALDSLLEPIVAGANKLSATSQLSVISMATTAMCEAWTDIILQRKIKFSIGGALQLEEDFRLVQTWLETYIQGQTVRQSVLALDIFKYLTAIADILKRQPHGRSRSRPPEARGKSEDKGSGSMSKRRLRGLQIHVGEGRAQRPQPYESTSASCEVSVGTGSSDQWRDSSSTTAPPSSSSDSDKSLRLKTPSTELDPTEELANQGRDAFKMPKMEQWLALRVHGGARTWPKLPSCFNNTQQ